MIKAITITNYMNESIRLELSNPFESGFVVQSIDGLGPAKANVNFTELATTDGAIDNSARLGTRNIVIQLLFLEHPTIEATRLLSYKYFPIKRNLKFMIETDSRICETIGRVESNEPNIFDKSEGCQISILCPDPYFYDVSQSDKTGARLSMVEPLFEFPFSNESLTEKLIEFGSIEIVREVPIFYAGDSEVGMTITIHATGSAGDITIYNLSMNEVLKIDSAKLRALTGSSMTTGDDIIISTVRGSKSITLLRNGQYTNILSCLDWSSDWLQLMKGVNVFTFRASSGPENLIITIENRIVYEGV